MNLDELISGLNKSAGFEPGNSGNEDATEGGEGKPAPKKDDKEAKEDKDKKAEQEKKAAFKSGSDLAKEIMEKAASIKINTNTIKGEDNMNKQASDAGKALAQALLKQAGVGDVNTSNGIMPGVVPHKSLVDQATQKAEHDEVFQATPGTDGLGNGGTINQIFDAIVADAMSKGVKDGNVSGNTAQAEGASVARQVPNQIGTAGPAALNTDSQEKTAAVHSLVQNGFDFDEAVNLVKQASDALDVEYEGQVKQAAFNELIQRGASFEEAVALVKQASEGNTIDFEKKAALGQLLDAGVDFDQAVALVNEKAGQLYGA
jgi:hypothetical protein